MESLCLHEEDKHQTAFVSPDGICQFKKMPVGLINATATFDRNEEESVVSDSQCS